MKIIYRYQFVLIQIDFIALVMPCYHVGVSKSFDPTYENASFRKLFGSKIRDAAENLQNLVNIRCPGHCTHVF